LSTPYVEVTAEDIHRARQRLDFAMSENSAFSLPVVDTRENVMSICATCTTKADAKEEEEYNKKQEKRRVDNARRVEWVNSPENETLRRYHRAGVLRTGKARGCHMQIALEFYPHAVRWCTGHGDNTARDTWIKKHPALHQTAKRVWGRRKMRQFSSSRVQADRYHTRKYSRSLAQGAIDAFGCRMHFDKWLKMKTESYRASLVEPTTTATTAGRNICPRCRHLAPDSMSGHTLCVDVLHKPYRQK
jgi:hypothetical protein